MEALMNETIRLLAKAVLDAIDAAGPSGITKRAALDLARIKTCHIITTEEAEKVVELITEKEWAATYRDPIVDEVRYYITGVGSVARNQL